MIFRSSVWSFSEKTANTRYVVPALSIFLSVHEVVPEPVQPMYLAFLAPSAFA